MEHPVAVQLGGRPYQPTPRFWGSLFHHLRLSNKVFRYFTYGEVLNRIVERDPGEELRFCIERSAGGRESLLAVSKPRRPVLSYSAATELIRRYGGQDVSYCAGRLTSAHQPRSGEREFHIGPDSFRNRFVIEAPVDGFGDPRIYLSLLRQVCSNGAIGYSRAFRSDIRMGQDVMHTLERALMQFDHDEGFSALRQRFDSAQKSWASLRETLLLQKTLARLLHAGLLPLPDALIRLDRLAGDLHGLYGLANLDSMTAKRQRILPARCRVYDLLNFASEMATHHARPEGRMRLQAYIGSLVSDEYDLEGTAEKVPQFMDLFANLN
jgi:hypothetical protein